MANDNSRPDVAVFIDFENVYVSVRDKLDANPNFESIMDRCSELGRVVISRAYADWYRYPRVTSALYANGVEPMYVPTYYYDKDMGRTGRAIKNSADMNMCIDAMKTLFTNTNIAKFVLVTGDRDFIPLVNMIRQQGKDVIVIGIGGAASTHLAQSADEFIFYEQLIGKNTAATMREAARERDRQRPAERPRAAEVEVEAPPPPPPPVVTPVLPPPPTPAPEPAGELDPFDTLVDAVHLARKRGYVCTLGSLKLVMKELMGGEFRESRYKDSAGRPFTKFKDFVQDAERRGKVQIFTSGTINEVFLPGEDPYKLSQFAGDLKEEPGPELKVEPAPTATNGRQPPRAPVAPAEQPSSSPANRSRRRRRSRGGRQVGQPESLTEATTNGDDYEDLSETTDEIEELAALSADDVFDAEELEDLEGIEVVDDELVGDDELMIADDVLSLPSDDAVAYEDISDLDRLEPIEQATAYLMDEVELLAQVEAVDEIAMALVAEITAEQPAVADQEADNLSLFDAFDEEPFAETPFDDSALVDEPVVELVDTVAEPAEPVAQVEQEAETPVIEAVPTEDAPAVADEISVAETAVAEPEVVETPEAETTEVEVPVIEVVPTEDTPALADEIPVAETASEVPAVSIVAETASEVPAAFAIEETAEVEPVAVEQISFSDEEWQTFREMMGGFSKPVAFAQIFDALRGLRQNGKLNRTNEQLRTLAKQAINSGLLERSGRGTRVYYRLPQPSEG